MIISTQQSAMAPGRSHSVDQTRGSKPSASKRAASRGAVSVTTIASYVGVFLMIVSLMTLGYQPKGSATVRANATTTSAAPAPAASTESSVDKLMATTLASSLAESTDMPISANVANLSQSLAVESVLAQTDTNVISKPQIVQPTASTRAAQKYTTVAGDSVTALAAKYRVSPDTIKWANNLTSDALEPGRELTILPVDGVLYTVKAGDTTDSITAKYNANKTSLIAYNDLELTGNPVAGSQIIVPSGVVPENERPGYVAPRSGRAGTTAAGTGSYSGGYGSSWNAGVSAGNRYAPNYCTWYAYERRVQLGRPIGSFWGNANTWAYNARSAGFAVNGTPAPGAIMANGGYLGHVAIVESVNPGVSVTISEMNGSRFGGGYGRVGHGDISWSEAISGYYQYIH